MRITVRRLNRLARVLYLCLAVALLLFRVTGRARAAVTLVSFTATEMDSYVLVEWETATEFENSGFFVQTSDQQNGTYTRIGDFIFADIGGATGANYSYEDHDLTPGAVKWYRLESIATDQSSEFSEPISVTLQAAASTGTPTATGTFTPTSTSVTASTPTSTPTSTQTSDSAYPGPETTPTSPYPGVATTVAPVVAPTTAVPQATVTSNVPANQNPTQAVLANTPESQEQSLPVPNTTLQGTLVPLPSITIQFAEDAAGTPVLEGQVNIELARDAGQSGGSSGLSRYGTLGFILLIWALLGGWFWFSFRKFD